MRATTTRLLLLSAAAALVAPGCGSSNEVPVSGRLLKGGVPYRPPEGQKVGVTLYAVEVLDARGARVPGGDEPYAAQVRPADGTFVVPGREGRGIPPGSYRVAIVQTRTREALNAPDAPRGNRL